MEDLTSGSGRNYYYQNNNEPKKEKKLIEVSSLRQLFVFLFGWLGIRVIAYLASFVISLFIKVPDKNVDLEAYTRIVNKLDPILEFSIYLLALVGVFAIVGIPALKRIFKDFKNGDKIVKGFIYGGILLGATIVYNMFISTFYPIKDNANEEAVNNVIINSPILSFFFVTLFAPIVEEFTYRLGLFGLCAKKNKYLGFILSSLIFGLIHSPFLSGAFLNMTHEELIIELLNLPAYMISGLILCLAYYNEESLVTSMTAHFTNNFVAFIMTFAASGAVQNVRIF